MVNRSRLPAVSALLLVATGCSASTESAAPVVSARAEVKVELGHCFVEPVAFDGEQWNVPLTEQFGTGGLQPKRWRGRGLMTRVGEHRARFADNGGSVIVFLPVDHSAVRGVEDAPCY